MESILFDYKNLCDQVMMAIKDPIVIFDEEGHVLFVNTAFEKLYGWTLQEMMGARRLPFLSDAGENGEDILVRAARKGIALKNAEVKHKTKDGHAIHFSMTSVPLQYAEAHQPGLLAIMRDITGQKAIDDIIEQSPEPVFIHDHGEIIYMNRACVRFLNADGQENQQNPHIYDYIHEDFVGLMQERVKHCYRGEEIDAVDIKINVGEQELWVTISPHPVIYNEKHCMQVTLRDVTAEYALRQRLQDWEFYDSLTRLPNRRFFMNYVKQKMDDKSKDIDQEYAKSQFALLSLDCDHFKQINDKFGPEAGDRILIQIGRTIQRNIRESDTVARMGGDEFYVLFKVERDPKEVLDIIDQIIHDIGQIKDLIAKHIKIEVSKGLVFQAWDETIHNMMKRVDRAVYKNKRERLIKRLQDEQLRFGSLSLDIFNQKVYVNNVEIGLSTKEFLLLTHLVQRHDETVSLEELYQSVWGTESFKDTRTIMVHISNLRKKLERNSAFPKMIKTVRGKGYRFNSNHSEPSKQKY